MARKVDSVISVAKKEVGYLEKKTNKSLDSKTSNAGSNNYTKYGAWFGANPAYWCDEFVCWCFHEAYGDKTAKSLLCGEYSAYCETTRANFRKKKQYVTGRPKKGDLIFFSGTRHAGANHIGIVTEVKGSYVYTVEGNTSGASGVVDNGGGVANKRYEKTYSRIMGYGRPDYTENKTYSGTFPKLPDRGYFTFGDGYQQLTGRKSEIKKVQKFLNWAITAKLNEDGEYGVKTRAAVKSFQKLVNITSDGAFGETSLAYAKAFLK